MRKNGSPSLLLGSESTVSINIRRSEQLPTARDTPTPILTISSPSLVPSSPKRFLNIPDNEVIFTGYKKKGKTKVIVLFSIKVLKAFMGDSSF